MTTHDCLSAIEVNLNKYVPYYLTKCVNKDAHIVARLELLFVSRFLFFRSTSTAIKRYLIMRDYMLFSLKP